MKIQVRASSLGELFDCPKRWAAKHLDGIRSPGNAFTHMGTAIHAGTAAYDSCTDSSVGAEEAVGVALDRLRVAEGDDGEPIDWGDFDRKKAEQTVINLTSRYCHDFAPHQTYTHVELPVNPVEVPYSGVTIELTGTVDRVRFDANGFGIDDLKTGGRLFYANGNAASVSKHRLQLGVYQLLAADTLGIAVLSPARIVAMQTSDYRIQAVQVGAAGQLDDLVRGTSVAFGALDHAARMLREGDFFGNARSEYCRKKFCPIWQKCNYR